MILNRKMVHRVIVPLVVIVLCVGNIPGGMAQEKEMGIVTVTANKTKENAQEVPISMTVLDEVFLEDANIDTIKDIAEYTPNLLLFEHPGLGVATTMRGISADPNLANSVAMFVDGVPVLGIWGFDETLMDIERVEVLKGPQGTLYGKEAEAGVINVITRAPGNQFRGKIATDLGSDNKRSVGATLSGPLVRDKLFAGISAKYYDKEGYIRNSFQGRDKNDRNHAYGKLNLRATPSDRLELSLVSGVMAKDSGGTDTNGLVPADPAVVAGDLVEHDQSRTASHALKTRYEDGPYTYENILAFREHNNDVQNDWDFSPMVMMHGIGEQDTWRLSDEFRVSGESDNFKWLAGLYGDKDEYDGLLIIDSAFPGYSSHARRELGGRSLGVFGSMTYDVSERFSLSAGLRYDRDEKTFKEVSQAIDLENTYSALSPKIALNYRPADSSMLYATVSRGYRSGGFSPIAPAGMESYDRETITNYEIGSKNSWLDNRLQADLSLFYMDISDMQVTAAVDATSYRIYVSNAAEAESYGLELELNYRFFKSFSAFASLGMTETEFTEFRDAQGDYTGNTNILAPRYTFNTGIQYRDERGLFARVDLNGVGKTYLDKANLYEQDAYCLVNAKAGYEGLAYDIYLYARNAFNESYNAVGYFGAYTVVSPPREIGVRFTYRF